MNHLTDIYRGDIWLLTVMLFATFTIFSTTTWGSIVIMGEVFLIFFLIFLLDQGRVRIKITYLHVHMMLFSMFCFCSMIWASNKDLAATRGTTILEILICISILYLYYHRLNKVEPLLKAIMWGSNIVMIYAVVYYGVDYLTSLLTIGKRIEGEFANSNALGLLAAFGAIINLYFLLYQKFKWWNLFIILSILIIAVSGSRKALTAIIIGFFLIILQRQRRKRQLSVFKTVAVIGVGIIALMLLSKISIFQGILGRMDGLAALITGNGEVDNSALTRSQLIQVGITQFKQTPLLGIGMDNARLLTKEGYYLHNNFVEMLADGGIIGFLFYYSFYAYLFFGFYRLRKYKSREYSICLILLIILLIMDYGMVSYQTKTTYFYFMVFFLYIEILKQRKCQYWKQFSSDKFEVNAYEQEES